MKFNVFTEQKKSELISKYLESIAQYKVEANNTNGQNGLTINIGGQLFSIDTTKNKEVNSRGVLNR